MDTSLTAGTGRLKITPPFDCEMSGFVARKGTCRGVHDDLYARALVISNGRQKVALVNTDLIGIDSHLLALVRQEVAKLTDLSPDSLILAATHTHSGPAVLTDAFLGVADPNYLAILVKNIAGAIYLANQSLEPVQVRVGSSECWSVAKNRLKEASSIDPQVLVVRIDGAKGVKALLVNYACHPVVLGPDNLLISGDYPFYLTDTLERLYPKVQVMFFNGATGDLNVGHKTEDSIKGGTNAKRTFTEAGRIGRILAGETLQASETATPVSKMSLKVSSRSIKVPLESIPTPEDYRKEIYQWQEMSNRLQSKQASFGEFNQAVLWSDWARRMADLAEAGHLNQTLTTEIAALAIGDIELITLPGEFFHEFGLTIKAARAPRQVFVMGYSNGDIGYVAPESFYEESCYEVTDSFRYYGLPARLAKGTGEKIVAEVLAMLEQL